MMQSLIFLFSVLNLVKFVLYIILLEVVRTLSRFRQMAGRSKVVAPRFLRAELLKRFRSVTPFKFFLCDPLTNSLES